MTGGLQGEGRNQKPNREDAKDAKESRSGVRCGVMKSSATRRGCQTVAGGRSEGQWSRAETSGQGCLKEGTPKRVPEWEPQTMGSTFYVSGTFFPGTGTGGIARDGCPSLNPRYRSQERSHPEGVPDT